MVMGKNYPWTIDVYLKLNLFEIWKGIFFFISGIFFVWKNPFKIQKKQFYYIYKKQHYNEFTMNELQSLEEKKNIIIN